MNEEKKLTDEEKQRFISLVETGLAFGGGKLSFEGRKNVDAILDGNLTADEVCVSLDTKYKR